MYTFWDLICDNPKKPWSWYGISQNPNITCDIVRNNPDKPWDWIKLSYNEMNQPYYKSSRHKKTFGQSTNQCYLR